MDPIFDMMSIFNMFQTFRSKMDATLEGGAHHYL